MTEGNADSVRYGHCERSEAISGSIDADDRRDCFVTSRPAMTDSSVLSEARDICGSCGACCAALVVDFHASCLASREEGGVPDALTVPVTGNIVRMRGTDAAPPRCCALEGEVGVAVRCTIYEQRPGPCRDFAPYAALGIAEPGCDAARRRHGLRPL